MKSSISMKSWKTTISLSALLFLMFALTVLSWSFLGVSMPSSLSSPASPANGSITYDKGANVITATGYSSGTPCTFWDLWNASNVNGWGVVWNNDGNNTQYQFDCKLIIGDGANETYFIDTDKQILFTDLTCSGNWQCAIRVKNNATFQLGTLNDATNKYTSAGCSLICAESSFSFLLYPDPGGSIYLYSSLLEATGNEALIYPSRIWHCVINGAVDLIGSSNPDVYDMIMTRTKYILKDGAGTGTWDKISSSNNVNYFIYLSSYGAAGALSNIYARGLVNSWSKAVLFEGPVNFDTNLTNCDFGEWTFTFTGSSKGRLYRKYTFDLTLTYQNNKACNNANATLFDVKNAKVFSVLTNSLGQIPTQTVTRGFYNQTGGNTIYDYGPFTLNITSTYAKYSGVFQLTQKTNWTIALQPLADGGLIEHVGFVPVDPGLTSPSGTYRWLDVADQAYGNGYRNSYNYSQAAVEVAYCTEGNKLQGLLKARNLKPNFAYQLKLVGTPGTADNERIGLAGRWWQEEWTGTTWVNGQNLNYKGDGSSPNPNDQTYLSRRYVQDSSSPTGYHYRYTGYLVFNYFITDSNGTTTLQFETGSCYHVIWKTTQRSNATNDGPAKTVTFDPTPSQPGYDTDYPSNTVSVFGEWERLPMGQVNLQPGEYNCQILLTEESFHGSGGTLAGNWAGAVTANIMFTIN